jgi:hypothetical protein
MMISVRRTVCIAMSLLLLAPTLASACPIGFRSIGPVKVKRVEVVRPIHRRAARTEWKRDTTWTSTSPELNQVIVTRGGPTYVNASFARQDSLSIDAAAPADNGWVYGDDDNEDTPPCAMNGQGEWQPPVILVRENKRTIRIAAVAQRTTGDRTGCVLGGGQDASDWGCPTLTRTIMKLHNRVGNRQLIFETFA